MRITSPADIRRKESGKTIVLMRGHYQNSFLASPWQVDSETIVIENLFGV